MERDALDPEEQDIETLLRVFSGDDDVRHLRDFALGGSRVARQALVRVARMGGNRGIAANMALASVQLAEAAEAAVVAS